MKWFSAMREEGLLTRTVFAHKHDPYRFGLTEKAMISINPLMTAAPQKRDAHSK